MNLNEKIAYLVQKDGTRKTAMLLVNSKIKFITGGTICLSDLPDSSSICEIIDMVEDILTGEWGEEEIKQALSEIDESFVEELVYE